MSDLDKFKKIIKSSSTKKSFKKYSKREIISKLSLKYNKNDKGEYFTKKYTYNQKYPEKLKYTQKLDKKLYGSEISIRDLIFFDLETTSLSLGAGNYPFLIGIGFLKNKKFVIKQFLYSEMGSENAIIDELKSYIKDKVFVTYNGKCFDIPLLKNRLLINSTKYSAKKKSIDLLYIMRRLFKYKLKKFDLQTVSAYLNTARDKYIDIHGSEIPKVFKDYIHFGEIIDMKKVLYHNERDIFSLFKMLKFIEFEYNSYSSDKKLILGIIEYELLSNKYFLLKNINHDKFLKKDNINYKILKNIIIYYKRQKKWEKVENIILKSLKVFTQNLFLIKEITKVYYLRLKKYKKAVIYATTGYKIASKYGLNNEKKYYLKIINRYKS